MNVGWMNKQFYQNHTNEVIKFLCFCSPVRWLVLEEPTVLKVVFDDDVSDCVKDELHVLGIGGAGEVGVDLLGVLPLIQVLKLTLNVSGRVLVRAGSL